MKKNNWILLFLLGMGFSFFACSGSDPEVKEPDTPTVPETPKETITCSITSLNATSEGGEYVLEFTASSSTSDCLMYKNPFLKELLQRAN